MKDQRILFSTFSTAVFCLILTTQAAFAGMTISGTRIVFPGGEREQTVRTTNKSQAPLLAQVWVDDGGKNDDINKIKVPFAVTPPVYRVEPGKGQSVRLIYNGMSLPQDRESVFWFNLLEIPPMTKDSGGNNYLELAFRTRIKIFYRPSQLKSSGVQEIDKIKWEALSLAKGIKVTNPTPYYLSFDSAWITSGSTKYPLTVDMIPPFSSKTFLVSKDSSPSIVSNVMVRMINDYGGVVEYQLIPSGGNGLTMKTPR